MKSETELIMEARAGSHESFAQLVSIHKDTVHNLVRRMAPEATEDLTQEIFMRAYSKLGGFRGQSSFKTWLMRLAINHVKNYLRKLRVKEVSIWDADDPGLVTEPTEELGLEIKEALMALSHKHREVIVLHDLLGFEYKEMGEILRVSVGTIKSRLFHARKQLREILIQEG